MIDTSLPAGVQYCDKYLCLIACVRNRPAKLHLIFFLHFACDCGSVSCIEIHYVLPILWMTFQSLHCVKHTVGLVVHHVHS